MEFRQLRYFRAVARFRSFTRAAEHEHVAQPSLSQQIHKLEDDLGARLFNRLGRRVTLTPFGERFLEHATRVLLELDGARQEIQEIQGLRRGRVSLGAIPTLAPYLLPRILKTFAASCPGITVNVREGLTLSLLSQLSDGEMDLALLTLPVRGEFTVRSLLEDRMLLAVPSTHAIWKRRPRRVAFRDVVNEPLLLLKDGHCFRDDVLKICKRGRANPNVVFEGDQFDTLISLVASGAGITLLPEMARKHYHRSGVGFLEFQPPAPRRIIGIVRAKNKLVAPGTQALIDAIVNNLQDLTF
jgi:LysR family transcriptional regulator, hydrogen peroxide-inducible genes activator